MVLMPEGDELVNIPPPAVDPAPVDEDEPEEYDVLGFTIGRSLGGSWYERTWTRLGRNRVVVPPIGTRPLRFSTAAYPGTGTFSFARHYPGYYARSFTWNVFYHSPPCAVALSPGSTHMAAPDHEGPPMWVPFQDHGVLVSYRCNCPLCQQRSYYRLTGRSRHLWAFTVPARIGLTTDTHIDPRDVILRVADWIFRHNLETRRTDVLPNGPSRVTGQWTLHPTADPERYRHWFYYHCPEDPLFDGRPTVYIPVQAVRLGGYPL